MSEVYVLPHTLLFLLLFNLNKLRIGTNYNLTFLCWKFTEFLYLNSHSCLNNFRLKTIYYQTFNHKPFRYFCSSYMIVVL